MDSKKKIAVLGLGKSGMSVIRFLAKQGVQVFASDSSPYNAESPAAGELEKLRIPAEWGGHTSKVLESDVVVISPGVLPDLPILKEARHKKIPIWPEIEVAYRFCPGPVIAITGTNGKSTVAALTAHLMNENGMDARVAGNIGTPLLDQIESMSARSWAVMEVSSFQLETIVKFRPKIACITTITQDHLNRHPGVQSYIEAKARILENQEGEDVAVLNVEDPATRSLAVKAKGKVLWFGRHSTIEGIFLEGERVVWHQGDFKETLAKTTGFPLQGEHNVRNLVAAVAVCFAAGLTTATKGIDTFKGLPHRFEFVTSIGGIDFYDDSKATNPDALAAALNSFNRPVVLIAGGDDKSLDSAPMARAARGKVKALVALGKNNAKILEAFSFLPKERRSDSHDLKEAVRLAFGKAGPGDVVILSPGCASFDLFHSAEERGEQFQKCIRELAVQPYYE